MRKQPKTVADNLSVTLTLEEYQDLLEKEKEYYRLQEENALLRHLCWGRSSERGILPKDPEELKICLESPDDIDPVAETVQAEKDAKQTKEKYNRFRKNFAKKITPHARQPIPENLEREVEVLEPEEELDGAIKIGEEVSEQLALRPNSLYVKRLVRPRYKLSDGRIVIAPLPIMAHPRSNASESVLAHIAVAKYADHLPLNRQMEIFERENIRLSASTVSNWMQAAAQRLEPIYNEVREQVRSSYYVMADETPHKVLESEKKGTLHQGYIWNFYQPDLRTPYFEYHTGRGSAGANILLGCDVRVVQSDGFAVYDKFDKMPGYLHLCCWAHVRRRFKNAELTDPPRARHALQEIGKLYAIEQQIRDEGLPEQAILELRKQQAYPVITALQEWCQENLTQVPKESLIGKAINYLNPRFLQLSQYINDARFQIDNNMVERSIRPLTLSRKNCLFSGSHNAAHSAAIFFTLLGACKEHQVNPYLWMKDALIKVQTCNPTDYSCLLPWKWKNTNK